MKRLLCGLLCLILIVSALPVLAEEFNEYTLKEKLQYQLELNGVRGAFKLTASGDAAWLEEVKPFSGATIQLRGVKASGRFQYELYAEKNDSQVGKTELFGDSDNVWLKSDFLLNTLLKLPLKGDLFTSLSTVGAEENPSLTSVALRLLTMTEKQRTSWREAIAPVQQGLEYRLDSYASAPDVRVENGETLMLLHYELPAEAVKSELKAVVGDILSNESLLSELKGYMTDAQAALYLNPDLQWYYNRCIDGLPLDETSVVLERLTTIQGEQRSSSLILPLTGQDSEWTQLELLRSPQEETLTLVGNKQTIRLIRTEDSESEQGSVHRGILQVLPAEGEAISAAYSITSVITSSTDSEEVEHDVTTWTVQAEPDFTRLMENGPAKEEYLDFSPILIRSRVHYYSKPGQRNATTLEVEAIASLPQAELTFAGKVRPVTPWAIEEFDTDGAADLAAMTAEDRATLLSDFFQNARLTLSSLETEPPATEEPIASPEPEGTEAAETPTPEETAPEETTTEVPEETTEQPAGTDEPADEEEIIVEEEEIAQ